jgi:RNA polymerase sigma-B factor
MHRRRTVPPEEDTASRFRQYRRTGDRRIRNRLVEENQGLVEYYVKRYSRRGVATDDLRQLALLAIVQASERFDPELGIAFSTFAGRTIEGELKRYFRDRTWSVRPPRRSQELHLRLRITEEELAQTLGRSPTVFELARELDETEDHVLEAMEAGIAHQATSLDQPAPSESGRAGSDWALGDLDDGFELTEDRMVIRALLDELPDRERTVLYLRFFERMSQPEIADRIGVSQSYLSRILRRALLELRERAAADAIDPTELATPD